MLFGAGNIAEKTLRILNDKKVNFIVDNASNLWGEIQNDLEIQNPITLIDQLEKIILYYSTTSFSVNQYMSNC